jgi:hypothetical protein
VLDKPSSKVKETLAAGDRLVLTGGVVGTVVTGGGGGGGATTFLTVTVIAAEVVVSLAVLVATAVSLWLALVAVVVFQLALYGAVVTAEPKFTPSSLYCTFAMPWASVTVAVMVWVPLTVAAVLGLVILIFGAVGLTVFAGALALTFGVVTLTFEAADICKGADVSIKAMERTAAKRSFWTNFDKLVVII